MKYHVGDVVAYRLEESERPGFVMATVLEPTKVFITGQMYKIRAGEVLRPSSWMRPPKEGKVLEVVEQLLVPIDEYETSSRQPLSEAQQRLIGRALTNALADTEQAGESDTCDSV